MRPSLIASLLDAVVRRPPVVWEGRVGPVCPVRPKWLAWWQDHDMASSVQLIRGENLAAAPYAYAATAPKEARLIFLAGSCPLDADGATVAVGDYRGQAVACVETMKRALAAAGATITDVISTRVLVASASQSDLVAVGV